MSANFYNHESIRFVHTNDSFLIGNGVYILFMRFPNNENSQEISGAKEIELDTTKWIIYQ